MEKFYLVKYGRYGGFWKFGGRFGVKVSVSLGVDFPGIS